MTFFVVKDYIYFCVISVVYNKTYHNICDILNVLDQEPFI